MALRARRMVQEVDEFDLAQLRRGLKRDEIRMNRQGSQASRRGRILPFFPQCHCAGVLPDGSTDFPNSGKSGLVDGVRRNLGNTAFGARRLLRSVRAIAGWFLART
ncbi:hypothetical protein [Bradyrhizobium sp. 141]|uniref:hypothetical protein n=1 Tax=Bradyrhizobium sp. 141 TaxID=2782617 RepID=UPI001FF907EA|nr:hypothetical protein [Bradyrhizobium sp. 141]MCK1720598.1 hypothetical protein [Bradyrhizobium sp. 141]